MLKGMPGHCQKLLYKGDRPFNNEHENNPHAW